MYFVFVFKFIWKSLSASITFPSFYFLLSIRGLNTRGQATYNLARSAFTTLLAIISNAITLSTDQITFLYTTVGRLMSTIWASALGFGTLVAESFYFLIKVWILKKCLIFWTFCFEHWKVLFALLFICFLFFIFYIWKHLYNRTDLTA